MNKKALLVLLITSLIIIVVFLGIVHSKVGEQPRESSLQSEMIKLINENVQNKEIEDLRPKVEDILINYAKTKVFEDSYKMLSRIEGTKYNEASKFVINLSELSATCEGDTHLYRKDIHGNERLLNEFTTKKNEGNSYLNISGKLGYNLSSSKYINSKINDYYLKGTVLTAKFYINPENWTKIIAEKAPFKYIGVRVTINELN